jgi:hypothetical protein
MAFALVWVPAAAAQFEALRAAAELQVQSVRRTRKTNSSRQAGLFKQVVKCLTLLRENPRHPGLQTHEFHSIEHPYKSGDKVFEAYVQNHTPGAYRLFWCYGPEMGQITIIAITPHP